MALEKRIKKGHISSELKILGDPKHIKPGEYVGCIYNKKVWYGIVEEYCEEFDDFIVNFLHPSGSSGTSSYYYPSNKDSCAVPGHHILSVMSCPSLRGGSRIQYIFPKKEIGESIANARLVLAST